MTVYEFLHSVRHIHRKLFWSYSRIGKNLEGREKKLSLKSHFFPSAEAEVLIQIFTAYCIRLNSETGPGSKNKQRLLIQSNLKKKWNRVFLSQLHSNLWKNLVWTHFPKPIIDFCISIRPWYKWKYQTLSDQTILALYVAFGRFICHILGRRQWNLRPWT